MFKEQMVIEDANPTSPVFDIVDTEKNFAFSKNCSIFLQET